MVGPWLKFKKQKKRKQEKLRFFVYSFLFNFAIYSIFFFGKNTKQLIQKISRDK